MKFASHKISRQRANYYAAPTLTELKNRTADRIYSEY